MKKVIFSLLLLLAVNELAIAKLISAEEIFDELGFSSTDRKKIANGEFVSKELGTINDHELATAFAFLVQLSVDELRNEIEKRPLITTDPKTIGWSAIPKDGSLAHFETLGLEPNERERATAYLNAKPGMTLNLSKNEIASFNSIEIPPGQSPTENVTGAVRKQLFDRFLAYRKNGLSGIDSYERDDATASLSSYLRQATETLTTLEAVMPDFYHSLINYPKDIPSKLSEEFLWHNYNAHDEPVYILLHRLEMTDSGISVIVRRQFYVSGGYNGGQSISALFPVDNGTATLVFFVNRVYTDKISGIASTLKRSLGNKIMINQLKELFQKSRAKVEQNSQH